jgi:hypothetical protein
MKKITGLFLLALLILSCPNDGKSGDSSPADVKIPADIMGMAHVGYYYTYASTTFTREQEYALADEMGIVWMLRDFSWSSIEPSKGNWNWNEFDTYTAEAGQNNKKILGILDYDAAWIHNDSCGHPGGPGVFRRIVAGDAEVAAFCEYVRQTVSRYKNSVGAWCIWNEPNLGDRFWSGTPKEFFTLTKAAADAIREAAPDAVIIGGAFNTLATNDIWTKGIFESGAMKKIDFIAYHPYMPDAVTTGRSYSQFRSYAAKYGFTNKIWITEVGYPLDMGPGGYGSKVKEIDMPEMTVKTIAILAAGNAQKILWYEMFDHGAAGDPNDSEDWFGLTDRDTLKKKGGGQAYKICAHNIPGRTLRRSRLERAGVPENIAAYYFEGADGKHSLVIWNDRQSRPQNVQVILPGTAQKVWDAASGVSSPIAETSTYTLKTRDNDGNKSLQFFTWENGDLSKPPRISAR